MPRNLIRRHLGRISLALLFLAALAAVLIDTQAVAARDNDKDKRGDAAAPVVLAQISDIHMGLDKAPNAAQNLQRALEMIAQRKVDAIVVSGDIGERPPEREKAKQMIEAAAHGVPVFYVPGNHDETARDTGQYTSIFGKNYYEAHVKNVTLLVLDSQLLGNYDNFGDMNPPKLAGEGEQKSNTMLGWLQDETREREGRGGGSESRGVTIAVQHIPLDRGAGFPQENDPKPYWTSQEPYRGRVIGMLHRAGVRDILAGHLHHEAIYKASGFTIHLAPAIGYPIGGGEVGFAVHTISPSGDVKTEFVNLQ